MACQCNVHGLCCMSVCLLCTTRSSTKSLLLRNIHHRATCQPNIIHSIHRVQYQLRFTSSINKTTQNNSTFYTPPIQEQEEEETSKS
ncbi:hypothetical protein SETIT_8G017900v2 [Setaria italica]|uniref:Uncharacterized protein n=1 Tax=Setaria italica TaxID=4555 RepID=A0A368S3I8_SETIT|nr:hypothetical protein SETIT_8G017900v2 [Setaria italica]